VHSVIDVHAGLFCPFAHRVNLVRHIKGLQDIIPLSIVKPYPKGDEKGWPGWRFPETNKEYPNATVDHLFGSKFLHEVYFKADKDYKGRYSVPLLWDKKTNTIVNTVGFLIDSNEYIWLTCYRKAQKFFDGYPQLSIP
jgi:putative glutathione S-transferase